MAGFPEYRIEEWSEKLNNKGYTVPIFVQKVENKKTCRVIESVQTPGMTMTSEPTTLTNKTMCVKLYLTS